MSACGSAHARRSAGTALLFGVLALLAVTVPTACGTGCGGCLSTRNPWRASAVEAAIKEIEARGGDCFLFPSKNFYAHVYLSQEWRGGDRTVELVSQIPRLGKLHLKGNTVDTPTLRGLLRIPTLRWLIISERMLSPPDLEAIGGATGLVSLELDLRQEEPPGLARIAGLDLRQLVIHTGAAPPELGPVATQSRLVSLSLHGQAVTDGMLAELTDLGELRYLDLSNTSISDAGLVHLARLTKLNWLDLSETRVTGAGFSHLRKCPRLKHLALNSTAIGDEDTAVMATLPALESLALNDTAVTDGGLAQLLPLASLRTLSVVGTDTSPQFLREIERGPNLLTVRNCDGDVVVVDPAWVNTQDGFWLWREQSKNEFNVIFD